MVATLLTACLTILTVLAAASLTTALPVVLDVRPAILLLSALTAGAHLWMRGRSSHRLRRGLHAGLAAVFLVTAGAAAWDLTLAYRTEELSFSNADATLHGTLYLPRGPGPHPAIVLVHGSGRQPRDEYRFYARQYARHGVAALAYDKRGRGASTADLDAATYEILAADAAEAVEAVRRHRAIDETRVGLWGLSEGFLGAVSLRT
jgi:dipeptidyl aminopeptidase/acylaminoacyl peptidase